MHTIFTQPMAVDPSGVQAEEVEKARTRAQEMAKSENQPEPIVEKSAEGKGNAVYAEKVLTEQLHVKTDDYGKTKVGDVLKQAGFNAVTDFEIMKVGC